MSLRAELFPLAEMDLKRQYDWYFEHAGIEIAERYLNAFDASVNALAFHPGLGTVRKFKAPGLAGIRAYAFKAPFEVHLIFYRADATAIFIARVMHGARDLPRRLLE
jgi:plasmid stabilization system protein ParE